MKVGGTALLVAAAGVIVPFFAGWGICALWGEPRLASIFTGAAMVATSVGITAQVLASHGLLDKRASRIILTAAVVDDVLGLIVLALVSGMARGAINYLGIGLTAGLALGFTFLVARFGTRTVRHVMPRMNANLRLAESEFALAMTLLFALSVLAVYAGVAAIVGAFLAGMALSETAEGRVTDLTNGVAELLVPFFLVGIGMHLDFSAFARAGTLALAGVLLVAAVFSKFVACGAGALRMGRTDAIRVGVGMVPRGEVGMVVAQIGLNLGAIGHHIHGAIVFISVATTLIAPPLLKLTFASPTEMERETVRLG
jgi:Kef-type K+ transport system membrane component KefB